MATWVNVEEYELARPDVLAQEVSTMLSKVRFDIFINYQYGVKIVIIIFKIIIINKNKNHDFIEFIVNSKL